MISKFEDELESATEEGSPAWMTSFCDLVVLMLCFFVLLLSFAKTDPATFQSALGSVRQALGGQGREHASELASASPEQRDHGERAARALASSASREAQEEATLTRFRRYLDERGLAAQVELSASPRGIVLRARDRVLFESADASLKAEGMALLDAVRGLCQELHGSLTIEGHSDDRPIGNALFPSNWELSGARASAALRYLVGTGVNPVLVHVAGYADMHPIASNATEEGRAQNRRVEFVFDYDRAVLP